MQVLRQATTNPLNSVTFSARLNGTKLMVESYGSVGAEVIIYFYRRGTLPRFNGRPLAVKPNTPPVFNVVVRTGEKKTVQVPPGDYDTLVTLNGQPIGASTVSVNELNGDLGKALTLLALAVLTMLR